MDAVYTMRELSRHLASCVHKFTHVCLSGDTLLVDTVRSSCDEAPCKAGEYKTGQYKTGRPFYFNGSRFPIARLAKATINASDAVALLPSGISNWGFRWFERAPGADIGPGAAGNIAHQLYDSVLHEVDAMLQSQQAISVVIGDAPPSRNTLVHAIRRRLFAKATFRSERHGCFRALYSYSWSCDRFMSRYNLSLAAPNAGAASLRMLRGLARSLASPGPDPTDPWSERRPAEPAEPSGSREQRGRVAAPAGHTASASTAAPGTAAPAALAPPPRVLLLYGRSDASRRRLLNLSSHVAALRSRFPPPRWSVVLWEDLQRSATFGREGTQPVAATLDLLMRRVSLLLTPHGALPSVAGLLMRNGSSVFELFSSCMQRSWLPAHVLAALGVTHAALAGRSELQSSKRYRIASTLVDPMSGRKVIGCPKYPNDPDLMIDAARLATVVERLWVRDHESRRAQVTSRARLVLSNDYE